MDLKYKKTVLITMIVNSSHKRVIKITPNIVINLGILTGVSTLEYNLELIIV